MSKTEFSVMLKCSPFSGDLDLPVFSILAQLRSKKTLLQGSVLFRTGDPGDALYGVRRGRVAIEIDTRQGQRPTLATFGAGDVFGEIALLDGKGRTADAVAVQTSELFALQRKDVLTLIAREPSVGIKLIDVLCQRLRSMSNQIKQSLTSKLDARIAARLLTLAEDSGHNIAITQERLARSVSATSESVNRQLRIWENAGIIEIRRGCIVLKDAEALKPP